MSTFRGRQTLWRGGLASVVLSLLAPTVFAADQLVVYSGRSDKFVKPVIERFTAETGVKVTLHSAESTALLNKLRVEGDKTQADLFISNDAGNLQMGSELGLFRAVPDHIVDVIDENLRASDNTWVGLSARARVLVVNKNSADAKALKSVFELADPKWKGRLGLTNSTNESFIAGVTVYMEATDEARTRDWLKGLKENVDGEVFSKHSHIVSAVADGKKDVGLVNHYYIYRHLAEKPDSPVEILLPDQGDNGMGVAWNVAGVAITKHSENGSAAEKLVKFLVSEEGQRMFADVNNEYPTRKGVPAAEVVPAAGSYKVANVPMRVLGEKRDATIDLLESVGMP